MHGVFLDAGSTGDALDWSRLTAALDSWTWHHNTAPAECDARLIEADVVVTNKVVLDRDTIQAAPALKLICVAATGVNNVDLAAATERGIPVINVTGYGTPAVSQHVLALMLAFATRWSSYARDVADGAWQRSEFFCRLDHPIEELAGKTLVIVGHGELGAAVGRLAEAFDMTVCVAERPDAQTIRSGRLAFDDAIARADYLSLHCPLTDATRHLINATTLERMKPTAYLINTARGPVVDSHALIDALRAGTIAGAAVDVLDTEPPRDGHPLLDAALDNLIVTPHVAWASRSARQRMIDGVAANIEAFRRGDDSGRVNRAP
ncbi:D-2-hydroxyacid dehydrogenase [Salinisphaera sp. Q1T1-3]|uniref:D-2-hydroxyacid dehydrogenase n=1 Tax=Salinisphaera sp. Q1T1-3 TaxID=2321229 RepID=UPI000E76FCCC|nr:D-2-hydroxyacid dehydrogenase [Salinisphaera sp. Q1T1-3]RJS94352.1 D-2-hydroxyacid dehydrogenase [Salinisphaera sp. Q1T1-3]